MTVFVHNVYSDVLLYLGKSINRILNNSIHQFEYNIGDSSFILNYNPNYTLPAAIISYQSSQFFNVRPTTYLRYSKTLYEFPVVHNHTKNITLLQQEDSYVIECEMTINVDTQIQALQFKHTLENFIPLNKYLQFYKFNSYYTLGENFNNRMVFDPENDVIENLLLFHDEIKNTLDYYYSVEYQPLVRVTNSSVVISTNNDPTYSLNLNFEILTQLPSRVKLYSSSPQQQHAIENNLFNAVTILRFENVKVPINGEYLELENQENIPVQSSGLIITGDNNIVAFKDVHYHVYFANLIIQKNEYNNIYLTFHPNTNTATLESRYVLGRLYDVDFTTNTARFEGEIRGRFINTIDVSIKSYEKLYEHCELRDISLENSTIKQIRYLPANNIKLKIQSINHFRTEINPNHIKLTKIIFRDQTVLELVEGDFDVEVTARFITYTIPSISHPIVIDRITSHIKVNESSLIQELEFGLIGFDYYPIRNIGMVENINFEMVACNHVVSEYAPSQLSNYSARNFNLIIDTLTLHFDPNMLRYDFKVNIPYYNEAIVDSFSFHFTGTNTTISNLDSSILIDYDKSTTSQLYFSTTEYVYSTHFNTISTTTPLFLTINKKG